MIALVIALAVVLAATGWEPAEEASDTTPSDITTQPEAEFPVDAPDGTIPDVIGMDLQSAQDKLQANGYKHLESIDYTGRGRNQVVDSNWVVVDVLPAVGVQTSTAFKVTLFVVKDGEQ